MNQPWHRIGVLLALMLVLAGCRDRQPNTPPTVAAASTSSPATTTPDSPAPKVPVRPKHTGAAAILDQLAVTDEDTGAHYDRKGEWGDGWDRQPGGCTTRQLVLLHQAPTAKRGKGCAPYCPVTVKTPCWTSPYDGATWRDQGKLQIDHIVPLKEANRSRVIRSGPAGDTFLGAGRVWSNEDKHRFYSDPENLVAVTSSVNQAKGDLDPGRWKPADRSQWCWYGRTYTHIKVKYGLSVDPAELVGLEQLLATCTT